MRLWTLHPEHLDPKGLVAAWREALLAQKVLAGLTKGYRNHPQLIRFREQPDPMAAMGSFLEGLAEEATRRGYRFDREKINPARNATPIPETTGQIDYEWAWLRQKLAVRAPELLCDLKKPRVHPLFIPVPGEVRNWEKR